MRKSKHLLIISAQITTNLPHANIFYKNSYLSPTQRKLVARSSLALHVRGQLSSHSHLQPVCGATLSQLVHIKNTWPHNACVGREETD